jgi:hypothetical protein
LFSKQNHKTNEDIKKIQLIILENEFALALTISMMFTSNVKLETNKLTNYEQGFRLGVGANAGYSNDPPNYHLVQM